MKTSTFTVKIDEVFTHILSVEATDADEAYDKAIEVLGSIERPDPIIDSEYDYEFEPVGFTGNYSSEIDE